MAPKPGGVPFDEAIAFFRQKLNVPTETWTDLWQGMHARAFVVAGARDAALIENFSNAVERAIADGTTLADFREDFDNIVATHGWSYKGSRGWRSQVIFQTNLRTAYAAGKWEQAQRLKERRPWLRYVAVLDSRTRPEHRAWHGTVLPVDDPFWQTHFPPNGWNCRCTVQQLSDRDVERFGYEVSDDAPPVEMEPRSVNTPEGPVTIEVPKGIDSGFGYNVGEASWGRSQQRVVMENHGPWEPLEAPGGSRPDRPARLVPQETSIAPGRVARDEAGLRASLRTAIGGDERILTDPAGQRVAVTQGLVDHMLAKPARLDGREAFFSFIPELVERPQEIWVGFARDAGTGRVAVRRRYVKLFAMAGNRTIGLVADSEDGFWQAVTIYRGNPRGLRALRSGLRVYRKE